MYSALLCQPAKHINSVYNAMLDAQSTLTIPLSFEKFIPNHHPETALNRNKQVSFFQKAKMLHIPKWLKDNIQIYRLQEESRWHGACSISKKKQALLHVFTPLDYNSIMRSFPSVEPCASAYPHTL
jgi:hypothetical protein